MVRSLRFQFFWAPVTALIIGGAALGVEVRDRARITARFEKVTAMRTRLDRAILRLGERHSRTVRRTREALLERDLDNQVRILSRTSEQYLRELERLVADASTAVAKIAVPDAHPRIEPDMARLQNQLDGLLSYGHAMDRRSTPCSKRSPPKTRKRCSKRSVNLTEPIGTCTRHCA